MKFRRKSSEEISGFLDQGTHVTGELQFAGHMRIDGNFHGSISTPDTLIVGEHAVVHADIKAGEIEVHGRVFGNIEAARRIEIYPTGRVCGDIKTSVFVVNPGGVFDGRSSMVGDSDAESSNLDARRMMSKELDEAH
jgi:cytoskeletal protein CcmA (bactofilin family)